MLAQKVRGDLRLPRLSAPGRAQEKSQDHCRRNHCRGDEPPLQPPAEAFFFARHSCFLSLYGFSLFYMDTPPVYHSRHATVCQKACACLKESEARTGCEFSEDTSKFRVAHGAGVREHIADVAYTGEVHNHARPTRLKPDGDPILSLSAGSEFRRTQDFGCAKMPARATRAFERIRIPRCPRCGGKGAHRGCCLHR